MMEPAWCSANLCLYHAPPSLVLKTIPWMGSCLAFRSPVSPVSPPTRGHRDLVLYCIMSQVPRLWASEGILGC